MTEYIYNENKLLDSLSNSEVETKNFFNNFFEVNKLEQIVRCCDCKYNTHGACFLRPNIGSYFVEDNGFCNKGIIRDRVFQKGGE